MSHDSAQFKELIRGRTKKSTKDYLFSKSMLLATCVVLQRDDDNNGNNHNVGVPIV